MHLTPAYSVTPQLSTSRYPQYCSLLSFPLHATSSMAKTDVLPRPKAEWV